MIQHPPPSYKDLTHPTSPRSVCSITALYLPVWLYHWYIFFGVLYIPPLRYTLIMKPPAPIAPPPLYSCPAHVTVQTNFFWGGRGSILLAAKNLTKCRDRKTTYRRFGWMAGLTLWCRVASPGQKYIEHFFVFFQVKIIKFVYLLDFNYLLSVAEGSPLTALCYDEVYEYLLWGYFVAISAGQCGH